MTKQLQTKGSIQVIERMMSLLDALSSCPEPASLKVLAQATGLHPSTAHRILAMMTGSRIVERQEAGTYALGIRLLELGNIVRSRLSIRQVALPFMHNLHEAIGEAINLGIRDQSLAGTRRLSGRRSRAFASDIVGQVVSRRREQGRSSSLCRTNGASGQDNAFADVH